MRENSSGEVFMLLYCQAHNRYCRSNKNSNNAIVSAVPQPHSNSIPQHSGQQRCQWVNVVLLKSDRNVIRICCAVQIGTMVTGLNRHYMHGSPHCALGLANYVVSTCSAVQNVLGWLRCSQHIYCAISVLQWLDFSQYMSCGPNCTLGWLDCRQHMSSVQTEHQGD